MRIGSACSGIGGIDLGLERAGLGEVIWQIERDPFCRNVLARHWPNAVKHTNVQACSPDNCDLLCAGFPCQPVSVAGKRLAQADPRWLWHPWITRLISETHPKIVVLENVPGLRTAGLRDVLSDLAALGFNAEWTHFPASQLGAPHRRNRFWLVATDPHRVHVRHEPGWLSRAAGTARAPESGRVLTDSVRAGREIGRTGHENADSGGKQHDSGLLPSHSDRVRRLESAIRLANERGWSEYCGWSFDPFAGVDDGLPGLLGAARKALGNSVVVACAHAVGLAIKDACR